MVSNMVKTGIVAAVGVTVIVLSATLGWILVPNIVTSEAIITEDNEAIYGAWRSPPVPFFIQFFLFNCTNCQLEGPGDSSVVLELQQLGPFTFSEKRVKFNITEKDGLLTYLEEESYYYEPMGVETSLDESIITVNPVYFTLASLITDLAPPESVDTLSTAMHRLLNDVGEHPFMKRKIREILFEGWSLQPYIEILVMLSDLAGIPLPPLPEDPRFGYFYGVNGTDGGEFKIESGANGLDKLGLIRSWKGEKNLSYWDDQYCDMINGTDGAIYPPLVDVNERIYIFVTDLCRSIYTTYERDVETVGITANRFTVPPEVFDDKNPDNFCYCRDHSTNPELCFSAGLLDLRPCQFGAPVVLSSPHFYLGDEKYSNAFKGLKPVKEWHETNIDLEPLTAVPVFISERIQINIDVRRYGVPPRLLDINNTVFPVFWINETAVLDQPSADDVTLAVNVINGLNISRWCFLAAGIALVIASIVMLVIFYPK
ncbi:platelet glycoprotein 4-like [Daphnia carinata]|uniref:platelet glycoprotein 4-like n=1 Tax=Daphnia carinata TaxID=120202 RepID=UPI00257F22A7|nr:platelet glycoprotein 4-like [Daphnia carinata]